MNKTIKLGFDVTDQAQNYYQDQFHKQFCTMAQSRIKKFNMDRHREGDYYTVMELSTNLQQSMLKQRIKAANKIKEKNRQLHKRLRKVDSCTSFLLQPGTLNQSTSIKSIESIGSVQNYSAEKQKIGRTSLNWRLRKQAANTINHDNQQILYRLQHVSSNLKLENIIKHDKQKNRLISQISLFDESGKKKEPLLAQALKSRFKSSKKSAHSLNQTSSAQSFQLSSALMTGHGKFSPKPIEDIEQLMQEQDVTKLPIIKKRSDRSNSMLNFYFQRGELDHSQQSTKFGNFNSEEQTYREISSFKIPMDSKKLNEMKSVDSKLDTVSSQFKQNQSLSFFGQGQARLPLKQAKSTFKFRQQFTDDEWYRQLAQTMKKFDKSSISREIYPQNLYYQN